jgi:hypothetical protein
VGGKSPVILLGFLPQGTLGLCTSGIQPRLGTRSGHFFTSPTSHVLFSTAFMAKVTGSSPEEKARRSLLGLPLAWTVPSKGGGLATRLSLQPGPQAPHSEDRM